MFIDKKILEELKPFKPKDTSVAKRLTPSDSELDLILTGIQRYPGIKKYKRVFYECLILVLMKTGIRIDEAYNIHLEDIDLDNRTLFVRKAKCGKQRKIGLTRSACDILKVYLEERSKLA